MPEGDVLGSITNPANVTAGASLLWVLIQIIIGGVLLFLIIYFLWYFFSFNIHARVEERIHNATFVINKRAKLKKKSRKGENDVYRLHLMGVKNAIMPPSGFEQEEGGWDETKSTGEKRHITFESIFGITKRGKKAVRILKNGEDYAVIPWYDEDVKYYLQVSRPVRKQFSNNMYMEGLELLNPEPGFWQKYGAIVVMAGAFFVIAMIFFFLFQNFEHLSGLSESITRNSQAVQEYAEAMTNLANAMRETGGVQPIQ